MCRNHANVLIYSRGDTAIVGDGDYLDGDLVVATICVIINSESDAVLDIDGSNTAHWRRMAG
jgi:hypothetical protein